MKKFTYLFAVLCICSPVFLHAQGHGGNSVKSNFKSYTLKGTVLDASTGQPVKSAIVYVPDTQVATSTDELGTFRLISRSYFEHAIVACAGYTSKKLTIARDSTDVIIVKLVSAATSLNGVEIIEVKMPQSVNMLTETDLNRASGLSLQDALNNIPGVNMQSRSPWGGQHIIIRGYYPSVDNGRSNSENFGGLGYKMYINGIPVTDAIGTTTMDDIDYSTLGSVEVIKGPSPLYGSYIGGAVNLSTPKVTPNVTMVKEQAIGGSNGLFRTNTSFLTSDGKMDLWANYGHQTYDGFRPNDASRKDYAAFATNYHVSDHQTVSAYFSYSHSYEQLGGELDSAAFYGRKAVSDSNYMLNKSKADIESFRGGITDKYRYSKHFNSEATVFITGSALNQAFAHGFNKNQNLNFGGHAALNYETKTDMLNVNGTLGAAFIKTNQNAQGNFILPFVLPPFNPATLHMSASDVQNHAINYNIYTQWMFSLPAQQLSLTLGGSLNFLEFGTQNLIDAAKTIFLNSPVYTKSFNPVFTPSVSLLKAFNKNISVYANVAAGYTPPTLSQMMNTAGAVDASLQPEHAIQYEIGTKGTFTKDQRLSYQLALFDLDITKRLTQVTSNGISYYTNVGEQRNLGAELYASYSIINNKNSAISLVRPWISYTYIDAKYVDFKSHGKSSTGRDSIIANYSGNKAAAVAPNMFNAGIDITSKPGIYLFGSFQYMDKAPVTFDNAHYMKSYNILRARIGYKHMFGKHFGTDVFAGGDNLLGNTYYSFIFVGQNIQELAQGNDPYVKGGGGDGYILPAPYKAAFYGGVNLSYKF